MKRAASKKKPSLSLKGKKRKQQKEDSPAVDRFSFVSTDEVEMNKTKIVPHNTKKATTWALKLFSDWRNAREKATGN